MYLVNNGKLNLGVSCEHLISAQKRVDMLQTNRLDARASFLMEMREANQKHVNEIASKVQAIGKAQYKRLNGELCVWCNVLKGWVRV